MPVLDKRFRFDRRQFGGGLLSFAAGGPPVGLKHVADLGPPSLQVVGNPVKEPGLRFRDQGGVEHWLEEFRGIGLVVNFWATWCGPCREEIFSLERLTETLFAQKIAVLPLATDAGVDRVSQVRQFFDKVNVRSMPILTDAGGVNAKLAGSGGSVPFTVVVDRWGRIRARASGAGDWTKGGITNFIMRLV